MITKGQRWYLTHPRHDSRCVIGLVFIYCGNLAWQSSRALASHAEDRGVSSRNAMEETPLISTTGNFLAFGGGLHATKLLSRWPGLAINVVEGPFRQDIWKGPY